MELLFARWTLHPLRIHAPSLRRGLDSSVRPIASSNALEGYWEQGRALFLLPVTDLWSKLRPRYPSGQLLK